MNQIGDGKWLELLEGIVEDVEKIMFYCFGYLCNNQFFIYSLSTKLFTKVNRPCVELRLKLS